MVQQDPPRLKNGKINPAWYESVWKREANRSDSDWTAEHFCFDTEDLTELKEFGLSQYFKAVGERKLNGADLSGLIIFVDDLRNADLSYCDIRQARFSHDRGSPISRLAVDSARLAGTKGLWGDKQVFPLGEGWAYGKGNRPEVADHCIVIRDLIFPLWTSVKGFGKLPLFGVSNIALITILAYSSVAAKLTQIAPRFNDGLAFVNDQGVVFSLSVKQELIPRPTIFIWLLIASILLWIASLVYGVFCPDLVKEYSRDGWAIAGEEIIEYEAANSSFFIARWIAFIGYFFGSSIAIFYFVSNSIRAMSFLTG